MSYHQKPVVYQANPHAMGDVVGSVVGAIGNLIAGGTASFLKLAAPRFTMVGGVAKPSDAATLALFKALQQQMNRVASKKSLPVFSVDGAIGNDSKALLISVVKAAATDYAGWTSTSVGSALTASIRERVERLAGTSTDTPQTIAAHAIPLYADVKAYADYLGIAPAVASPKPASPPSYVMQGTNAVVPQSTGASLLDGWNRLGTPTQIAAVGALGIVGFVVLKDSKKKRK